MPSIIDNRNRTMLTALQETIPQSESIDIITAYFYFSGFNALADELKDKKVRILVGKTVDPTVINELCQAVKFNPKENLDSYAIRGYSRMSNMQKKQAYIDSFVDLFNKSTLSEEFDSSESQAIFKMFINKIIDGSLEIRITADDQHGKAFILTNKAEYSLLGTQKGVVLTGSSNLTYNGLLGQGELNERLDSNEKYDEYKNLFEKLWNDSRTVDISVSNGNKDFEKQLKNKLWIFAQPIPYHIYVRILYELYHEVDSYKVHSPFEITGGKFSNLKYQIDAIKYGVDCIKKNNGVIVADVVGLGKSVIASAIAYNLNIAKTVIIAPPHLVDQWNDYQQDFSLRGVRVYSSGKIEEVYNSYANDPQPILYIIDEAHRYRNELSDAYQWLHQLTRSNSENKVILLTATPYNNRPQDLFALIKLFQTPSRSTINTVENLSISFHNLIAQYNKLEKEGKKNLTDSIKKELAQLSQEMRNIISPVIVRRSRIDLTEIEEYANDLKSQNIQFPNVIGPELVEYDLGSIRELYISTLDKLSNAFNSARYNPSAYLLDPEGFNEKYGDLFNEMNIQQFQGNLAKFIKRLLVMRFESSKAAFKATLKNILASYENIVKWWNKGYVPIKKHGYLPDPDEDEILETLKEIENIATEPIDVNKIKKRAIPFEKELFSDSFIYAVKNDIQLLSSIYDQWFGNDEIGEDPKYNEIAGKIRNLLNEMPNRKIVVFSSYADTASYVQDRLVQDGFRSLLYSGSSNNTERNEVRRNFDASYPQHEQSDNYDIIVATDALSEGFNLNRSGIIVNYDIPYNPTRVVQRIGRINRINKMMFDNLYIFNFFPTDIGEETTLIRGISTLKMLLINNIVGSDTRTLTPDETLQSYFKNQYDEANNENSERSWDTDYINAFNSIKHNAPLIEKTLSIPERARIVRKNQSEICAVSFAKRGNNFLFAIAYDFDTKAHILPAEKVLCHFKAESNEKGFEYDSAMDKKFEILRDEIKRPAPKITIDKRKRQAIDNLEKLLVVCPAEKDYLTDLIDIIQKYDDLSDGELKYLARISVIPTKCTEIVEEVIQKIPIHYIIQIKERAETIDSQSEILMFTEDLRDEDYEQ